MDCSGTPDSPQDIYATMTARPPKDKSSPQPEPDKQHKTIEEHTDCDCDYSKKLDLQDPNKANQRSKQELPALEKPDVILERLKNSQTRLSDMLSRYNRINKPEDHNPPLKITVLEEKEEKNTPKLLIRPTTLNLNNLHKYQTLKPKNHTMHITDHTTIEDNPHDTFYENTQL